jgi:hypothetical protein
MRRRVGDGGPRTHRRRKIFGEAFRDGDRPCRVDLLDWHAIEDHFRKLIAAERVRLFEAASADAAADSQELGRGG